MKSELTISDRDIEELEFVLNRSFDEQRRLVLRSMNSQDVVACPGSGKTTALVAKLGVLSAKLPRDHGVCVLSHTNVAREEIKSSLGKLTGRLFRYPNFIGTIQSFVDRFVVVPALVSMFGAQKRPVVDDEFFGYRIIANKKTLSRGTLWGFLRQGGNRSDEEVDKFLTNLRFSFESLDELRVLDRSGNEVGLRSGKGWLRQDTDSYKDLLKLKKEVTSQGFIGFSDAYAIANKFLQDHPYWARAISSRFMYCFVDEMQDTDHRQWNILNLLLANVKVFQCFGDPNQAIYNANMSNEQVTWEARDPLFLDNSHRFDNQIAHLCRNVCNEPQELMGGATRSECKHTIFLYEDKKTVLPSYAELILAQELNFTSKDFVAKAVGYVGRQSPNLTITSYHPSFRKRQTSSADLPNFAAYCHAAKMSIEATNQTRIAHNLMMQGLLKLSMIQLPAEYQVWKTQRTFEENLVDKGISEDLNRLLATWLRKLSDGEELGDIGGTILRVLEPLFGKRPNKVTRKFLDGIKVSESDAITSEDVNFSNTFTYPIGDGELQIGVDTIHGVKGQTHTATLLLETFYDKKYHLREILEYLRGDLPRIEPKGVKRRFLSLAYVAMTRPTHLLCLAMRRDDVDDYSQTALEQRGWIIKYI